MHNHNKGGEGRGMMWMMIPCLLLLGFLFLGGGAWSSNGYLWPILIGIFVVAHVWMMFKGHRHGGTNTEDKIDNDSVKESDIKDEHKHSNGCH